MEDVKKLKKIVFKCMLRENSAKCKGRVRVALIMNDRIKEKNVKKKKKVREKAQ